MDRAMTRRNENQQEGQACENHAQPQKQAPYTNLCEARSAQRVVLPQGQAT